MTGAIRQCMNSASAGQIAAHLAQCDASFIPPLSERVDLAGYAERIAARAERFEAWSGETLAGLVAAYLDASSLRAFVTNVSVLPAWAGQGVGKALLGRCIEHARGAGMREIGLEVDVRNTPAIRLYEKAGFAAGPVSGRTAAMTLHLRNRQT